MKTVTRTVLSTGWLLRQSETTIDLELPKKMARALSGLKPEPKEFKEAGLFAVEPAAFADQDSDADEGAAK